MKKTPIIILHGWGLSGKTFLPLARALKAHAFDVFLPDLPGFGTNEIPKNPLYLADYAEFLHIYMKKHHIENPILIGHSFGGRVSLKYNDMYPKSVRAIILSGTPGFTPINRKKLLLFIFIAKIGGAFWSLPPFCVFKEFIQKWYYHMVGARDFYRAEGSMRQTFKHIVQENLETAMKSVHTPCLLLWGENDAIVPVAIARRMASVISSSELVIIPAYGHNVPYANASEFSHRVFQFLDAI